MLPDAYKKVLKYQLQIYMLVMLCPVHCCPPSVTQNMLVMVCPVHCCPPSVTQYMLVMVCPVHCCPPSVIQYMLVMVCPVHCCPPSVTQYMLVMVCPVRCPPSVTLYMLVMVCPVHCCPPSVTQYMLVMVCPVRCCPLVPAGEHMTEYELAEYLTTLLGLNEEGGSLELHEFDSSKAGEMLDQHLPHKVTAEMFANELLGFGMYSDVLKIEDNI